jgi:hypothetical protein
LDRKEIEAARSLAEAKRFEDEDYELLLAVVDSYEYIAELAHRPGMTMDRLRELCLGTGAEKADA